MAPPCPWWAPPVLAVQFLTRLPMPMAARLSSQAAAEGLKRSVIWFPLVGAVIGAITAAVGLTTRLVWSASVAAVLALAAEALVTGAFHEDAVADFCDGFGGGRTPDDILRIMKDSRIGSYGAMGLGLAVALRLGLTASLLSRSDLLTAAGIIMGASAFGRLGVVALMAVVAPAPGSSGLGKALSSDLGLGTLARAALTALPGLFLLILLRPGALACALGLAALALMGFRALLMRRLGGVSGDCLGAFAYGSQLIALAVMVAA
jgi:adenosylcobinamide-GDP ribazoletransferase